MNKEHWQQIEKVFYAAMELPREHRDAFVGQACAGDQELQAEVQALLAAQDEHGDFLHSAEMGKIASSLESDGSRQTAGRAVPAQLHELLRECPACGECGDGGVEICPQCGAGLATLLPVERTVAGRYQIQRRIGKGGMGTVYQATDLQLRRIVALKVLGAAFIGDETAMRRFEREARAAARLRHPNVVRIYDHGATATGGAWLALEYVEGVTLREEMKRAGRLSIADVCDWFEQIAAGVKAAHLAGVVHRDLKPENIMLVGAPGEPRQVCILDFGLAQVHRTNDAPWTEAGTLTAPGLLVGTPAYMAPEQFEGKADERTDLFTLGVILAEMLTGQHPFGRQNYFDTRLAITREPYHLPGLTTSVRRLDASLQKCLAKESQKRYARMEQLQAELLPLLRNCPVELSQAPPFAQRSWRAARKGLRMKWPWVAVAFVMLAWLGYRYAPLRGSFEKDVLPNLKFTLVDGWKNEPGQSLDVIGSSPDGQQLVFGKFQNGQSDIYVKQIGGGPARALTNDAWIDSNPIWSPDGQQIAYLSIREGHTEIRLISDRGGDGKLLGKLSGSVKYALSGWARDGARIYYESNGNLYALDVASGANRPLTNFMAGSTKAGFVVSADDQWVAYRDMVSMVWQIFVAPMAGGAAVQVTHEGEMNIEPLWLPDNRRLVYASRRNGVKHLFVVERDGGKPVQFTFGHEQKVPWEVTLDGRKIFYVAHNAESSIYLLDAVSGTERQISTGTLLETFSAFSPDGRSLAYQQSPTDDDLYGNALLVKPMMGGESARIAESGFDPRWSPTGERLAFLREYEPNKYQLWTVRPDGTSAQLVVNTDVNFLGYAPTPLGWVAPPNFNWSPDGRRLIYASGRGGASNLYSITSDALDERQLTHNAINQWRFYSPLPSPDGQQLIYQGRRTVAGQRQRAIFLLSGDEPRMVWQTTEGDLRLLGWAASGDEIYFAANKNQTVGAPPEVTLFRLAIPPAATKQAASSFPNQASAVARFANAYLQTFAFDHATGQVAYVARQEEADNIWLASLAHNQRHPLTKNTNSQLNLGHLVWSPQANQLSFIKQSNADSIWMIENFQ